MVKGTLDVLLVEGKGIKDKKFQLLGCICGLNQCNMIKTHSYVVVQCGNQELTSDVANQEGKKLIWNKKLSLKLEYLESEAQIYDKLVLKLMGKHNVSDEDSIGEATIYIKEVLLIGKEKGNAELDTQKYRIVLPDKTYSGCICGLNQCNLIKTHSYVVVQCGNQELTSDVANQEGKKLIWNKKLSLKLEYLESEAQIYDKLVLKLMGKHNVSDEDSIGEATIYIKEVLLIGKEKGNAELDTQKYRIVLPDKTYSGEISVAVRFTVDL